MKNKAQSWLAAGLAVSVLGLVVAIAGSTVIGVMLMAIGVADLVIIALGFPSPMNISRASKTLYKDEDGPEHNPDDAFVSASPHRDERGADADA